MGQHCDPNALVLLETTVPPGTTELAVWPILKEELERRGLDWNGLALGYSYERVTQVKIIWFNSELASSLCRCEYQAVFELDHSSKPSSIQKNTLSTVIKYNRCRDGKGFGEFIPCYEYRLCGRMEQVC